MGDTSTPQLFIRESRLINVTTRQKYHPNGDDIFRAIDRSHVRGRPPPVMTRPRVPVVPRPIRARTFSPRPRRGGGVVERGVRSTRARGRRGRLASGMRRDVIPLGGIAREMVDASASARDAGEVRHPSAETRDAMMMMIREATREATRRDATRGDATDARGEYVRAHRSRARGGRADGRMDGRRRARGRDDAGRIINHRRRFGRSVGRSPCDENLRMRGSLRLIGAELIDWRRKRETRETRETTDDDDDGVRAR